MDKDVIVCTLEDVLSELDQISIGFEQAGQWEHQAKIQRVVAIVNKLLGDRNGLQSKTLNE